MKVFYDIKVFKKVVNFSVNEDFLSKMWVLNINLFVMLEEVLIQCFVEVEVVYWVQENEVVIKVYNYFVEEYGCFGDEFWMF